MVDLVMRDEIFSHFNSQAIIGTKITRGCFFKHFLPMQYLLADS